MSVQASCICFSLCALAYTLQQLVVVASVDKQRILSLLAFAIIIVVIGFPMWWKTTEVYRVPLPYNRINALGSQPIEITSKIGIFTHSQERTALLVKELNDMQPNDGLLKLRIEAINVPVQASKGITIPSVLESNILKQYPLSAGDFIFIEWEKLKEDVLVTSERSALISSQIPASQIHRVLMLWIVRQAKLYSVLNVTIDRPTSDAKARKVVHDSAAPSAKYDVLVSVFNPRPDQQTVNWDVQSAIETYLRPFVRKIDLLSEFVLKSQWKYQVLFEYVNKQVKSPSNESEYHYGMSEDKLPHIITSIEGKLGTSILENPTIHLVVYVPPCDASPLHIYNKKGQRASTDGQVESFLSSKWGAIIIANPTRTECSPWTTSQQKAEIEVNSHNVMHVALYLLRRIIDLHVTEVIPNANIVPLESIEPRTWEVDSYLRVATVHFITSASSTLQSLVQLLAGISNIVINDDVGRAVNEAYDNIVLAKHYLSVNDLLNAVKHAKLAFAASETAFFDPSLLALLYFPDDQKYAIYIPLFLPVLLPIVLSSHSIYKHFRA